MNEAVYRFRVFSPPKGVLLIVSALGLGIALFWWMDVYGPDWLQNRAFRLLLGVLVLVPATYFLGKLATTFTEVSIEYDGLLINNLPTWNWGKHEAIRIGWLELESWDYKKGSMDGHSISWDRLVFRLTHEKNLLLLPTDDFDEASEFPAFILRLEQAVNAYNARPSTHIPIQYGDSARKTKIWAWAKVMFWSVFLAMILLAMYLAVAKGSEINWALFGGALFMLFAVAFQIFKQVKSIRNAAKP